MSSNESKGQEKPKISNYGFNCGRFFYYVICNIGTVLLGSSATLVIALTLYAMNLQNMLDFDIISAFKSVGFDWLYTDVFVSILTLSIILILTYMLSFKNEVHEYLGGFSKVVSWLFAICFLLCIFMAFLEINYLSHTSYGNEANIGSIKLYNIIEFVSLIICGFLQTFSHPEYYMSPPQNF